MRDFLSYVRLTARVILRDDLWSVAIPVFMMVVVGGFTLYFTEASKWRASDALAQAEVFGPFMAAFLFAGLMDAENRRQAGEIVFSKPHSMSVLLGVRMVLALSANLGLLFLLCLCYRLYYGHTPLLKAMAYAVPPCLFIGSVAVTAGQFTRNVAAGYVVPLGLWLWDSTAGMLYNPLFVLPVGAIQASGTGGAPLPLSVGLSKGAMLVTAAFLFWINVRRARVWE